MPLRLRLIILVGLVLLVSLACGGGLVAWHAAISVRTELRAALDVGANTIRNGFREMSGDEYRAVNLRQLVATFDGNRHIRAMLLDAADRPLATSRLFAPTQVVPDWFRRLIAFDLAAVRLPVPRADDDAAAVVLRADPINEIGEVWGQSRDAVLVLAAFGLLSALLISVVVRRALRPLERLSAAFERIGEDDYYGGLSERGPPEVARLAHGFNQMALRLASVAAQNRRLNARLLSLQAEERADLARDLHDEIGPLLFAVGMTAATIERLAGDGRGADIPDQVRSIHDAVARMQRHVRAILGRLRPLQTSGLEAAVDRLVGFWRNRRPDIQFSVSVALEEATVDSEMKETIYRVVQEGLSNAIRHGKPARVQIVAAHDGADGIRVEVTDDGIGLQTDRIDGSVERGPGHFGLIGMRERIMAMAGSLTIRHGHEGRGLMLVASLPCPNSLQYFGQGALE